MLLVEEYWPFTMHLQTLVRALALRLGSGEVLRLMTSQNSQKASPYRTSPLKVLRSAAEQAGEVSKSVGNESSCGALLVALAAVVTAVAKGAIRSAGRANERRILPGA